MINNKCYEVMQHEKGQPNYMDRSISLDTCLTLERANEIAEELNNCRTLTMKFYYYVRMKDYEHILK